MLAGGAGRRFGGAAKGLESVGGTRIIDRVAAALSAAVPEIVLAANHPSADEWLPGVRILSDRFPDGGGLSGVEAALAGGRDAIVVAWDMPFVSAGMIRLLRDEAAACGADVVVPESDSPFGLEPFCAWYSSRLREPIAAMLALGGGAAGAFLRDQRSIRRLTREEIVRADAGDPALLFFSVNSAADLERARVMVSRRK